jgi:hypothetical protein
MYKVFYTQGDDYRVSSPDKFGTDYMGKYKIVII